MESAFFDVAIENHASETPAFFCGGSRRGKKADRNRPVNWALPPFWFLLVLSMSR